MKSLPREELVEKLDEIECWPELKPYLSLYLAHYICEKDLKAVQLILGAGANPNPPDSLNCHLYYLLHEYQVTKSTSGDIVLKIMRSLLEAGADANRVCGNNLRAYDYTMGKDVLQIKALLEEYGAIKELREPI